MGGAHARTSIIDELHFQWCPKLHTRTVNNYPVSSVMCLLAMNVLMKLHHCCTVIIKC